MNKSKIILILWTAVIVSFFRTYSKAIEIPLGGGVVANSGETPSGKNTSGGIAYIDIEAIFNEHPMTARLKGEFEADVDKKKKELSDIEGSMKNIQNIIVSTTTEINNLKLQIEQVKKAISDAQKPPQAILLPGTTNLVTVAPVVSTATVKADPAVIDSDEKIIKDKQAGIEQLKNEYSKKQIELDSKLKNNKSDLVKLESENTQAVLNDIYKVLSKIAAEENLTIVVDKNNVLYGQASQDITEKVRDRMRGR